MYNEGPNMYSDGTLANEAKQAIPQRSSLVRTEAERLDQLATQCELLVEQFKERLRPLSIDAPQVKGQAYKDPTQVGSDLGNALHRVSNRLNDSLQEFRYMMEQLDI